MEKKKLTIREVEEIDDSWTIMKIVEKRCPLTWEKVFEDAMPELQEISEFLDSDEQKILKFYPQKKDIFRAFMMTPLNKVKVVIIGQDPYHDTVEYAPGINIPRAVGMSFSVHKNSSIPPSLKNIYKELHRSIKTYVEPKHGDLTEWALQGVFLLNACLTVNPSKPGSHMNLWLGFVDKVINAICSVNTKCIFLLWGTPAQKLSSIIKQRGTTLTASHPSPYSAQHGRDPFIGCNHFVKVNEILVNQGQRPIDWQLSL